MWSLLGAIKLCIFISTLCAGHELASWKKDIPSCCVSSIQIFISWRILGLGWSGRWSPQTVPDKAPAFHEVRATQHCAPILLGPPSLLHCCRPLFAFGKLRHHHIVTARFSHRKGGYVDMDIYKRPEFIEKTCKLKNEARPTFLYSPLECEVQKRNHVRQPTCSSNLAKWAYCRESVVCSGAWHVVRFGTEISKPLGTCSTAVSTSWEI